MQNTFAHKLPRADLELVVKQCRTELAQLDGKIVLITGGTGFIGKCLLEVHQANLAWLELPPYQQGHPSRHKRRKHSRE